MSTPQNCPCDAVVELKEVVKDLKTVVASQGNRLSEDETTFALIQKDLDYIKLSVDKKEKFNTNIINAIVNGILTILIGYVAIRLGLQ